MSAEKSEKSSKESRKRKVSIDVAMFESGEGAVFDGVMYANGDEVVLNGTHSELGLKPKKRKKTHRDVKGGMEQCVQQEHSAKKKQVRFNLEPNTMSLEKKSMEGLSKGKTDTNESGADEEKDSNSGDASWVQKASWKSLVGETGRVAFSLGSVLGNVDKLASSVEQPPTKVHSSPNVSTWIDRASSLPMLRSLNQSNGQVEAAHVSRKSSSVKILEPHVNFGLSTHQCGKTDDAHGGLREHTQCDKAKKPNFKQVSPNLCQDGVEKGCTFMRSENYEQEWLEAKRAVKEIFKRTRKHKDVPYKTHHISRCMNFKDSFL